MRLVFLCARTRAKSGGANANGVRKSDVWRTFLGFLEATLGGIHHARASDVDAARGPWLRRAFAVVERRCASFRAVASR